MYKAGLADNPYITMPSIEIIDILRVIAICTFAGGTSFAGGLIARFINFNDRQVLFFTAFGAGILISAAIFGMVIEAEKTLGIIITLVAFVAASLPCPLSFTSFSNIIL